VKVEQGLAYTEEEETNWIQSNVMESITSDYLWQNMDAWDWFLWGNHWTFCS